MRTGLADILKHIRLVLEIPVVDHMFDLLVEAIDQDLEVLRKHDFFFLGDVEHRLGEVLGISEVLVERGMGEDQFDGFEAVEVEDDEVGAGLVGLLDLVNRDHLARGKGQRAGFHQLADLTRLDTQLLQLFGVHLAHELVRDTNKVSDHLAL